jgi:hypothetical protein
LSKPKHVPEFRDYVVEGEEGTGTQTAVPLPHPQISSHPFWILGIIFFLLHKKPQGNSAPLKPSPKAKLSSLTIIHKAG